MIRVGFVLAAAFALMGNAINVDSAPRIVQPRPVELGVPLTVAKGSAFLEADILDVDYFTLDEEDTFHHRALFVVLPAGTQLSSHRTYRRQEGDPVYAVYCGPQLVHLLGGKQALPLTMDRRIAPTYRLCFFADEARTSLTHVFIAGGSGDYAGIGRLGPLSVTHSTVPRETGQVLRWDVNDVWGSGKGPKAKMLTEIVEGEGRLVAQRIVWEREGKSGVTSGLTAVGSSDARLPLKIADVFGIFGVTILSADTRADTITYQVDETSPRATFIDKQGSVPGDYTVQTVYLPF